ncbi:MAG: Holliday junction branch migration DNA helicase RuvB [Spirochaetia bacterium]
MSDFDDVLDSEQQNEDQRIELTLRPQALDEFQGQSELKENLKIFVAAARKRGDSLDHVFLSGPPGLGKTTLAGIMANEMGVEFKVTSAPALEKPKDLAGLLTSLPPGSVFFIDEIHRLKPAIEEMLFIAMEDQELDWVIGQGPSARTIRIPLPSFTLVGATTKPGKVAGPLYSRFGITLRLDLYGEEEIEMVLRRSARLLDIDCDRDALSRLATSARGTPRVANRLLRRVRDFAEVLGDGRVTLDVVAESLTRLDIDSIGLERHDREILRTIVDTYGGGPVGAETLAISVGESLDTLEDFYEPFLIRSGMLKRTPRGRMITPRGCAHLGLEPPGPNENEQLLF